MIFHNLYQTTLQGTDSYLCYMETKDLTQHVVNETNRFVVDTNILHAQARMNTVRSRVKKRVVILYATYSRAKRSDLLPDRLVQPFPFAA